MSSKVLVQLNNFIQRIENVLPMIFGRGFPPESMYALACPNHMPSIPQAQTSQPFTLKDLIGDGFLWAVPRTRRTIEKRMKRKFGHPMYHMKILPLKVNLRTCMQCGHDHEVGVLCPNCYSRVMEETKQMQEKIEQKIGLSPDDKEVVVLYDGERDKPAEFWEGKRVIEMEKPRPLWFNKNLLQKTTQPAATTKEVKPTDLG